jgi:hypothetical protein
MERVVAVGFLMCGVVGVVLLAAWWSEANRADRHQQAIEALCDHLGVQIDYPQDEKWQRLRAWVAHLWPTEAHEPEPVDDAPTQPAAAVGGRHRANA